MLWITMMVTIYKNTASICVLLSKYIDKRMTFYALLKLLSNNLLNWHYIYILLHIVKSLAKDKTIFVFAKLQTSQL